MINELINKNPINSVEFIGTLQNEEIITSFWNTILWKYAYLSDYWYIFNFNTILCTKQTYWNYLSDKNFDDMANIEISKYDNSLKNGWVIQRKRASETIINLKMTITSNNITNLEKEIRQIKSIFNWKWKLYKKEFDRELILDVTLAEAIKVWEKLLVGTELDISFLSVSPFWKTKNWISINYESQTIPLVWTLTITDSDDPTPLKTIVQIWNITGLVNTLFLNLNDYIIEINQTINKGDIITFDWVKEKVYVNWSEVFYKWIFNDFPINTPANIWFNYSWWWNIDNYNLYVLYDKIAL